MGMKRNLYKRRNVIVAAELLALAMVAGSGSLQCAFAKSDSAPIYVPDAGEIKDYTVSGYAKRGSLMLGDANFQGAGDQLDQSLRLVDGSFSDEAERLRMEQALAAMRLPGADAMGLLEAFLRDFPASAMRERALMAIADVFYDRGDYPAALRAYRSVDDDALNPGDAEALACREGYCLLKLSDFDRAESIFSRLASTKDYANESLFYLGYIAYVKGDYRRASDYFSRVKASGMPAVMTPYYQAQIAFHNEAYQESLRRASSLLENGEVDKEFEIEARRIYGESLYQIGDENGAIKELKRYVAEASHPLPSALYILGVNDYRCGYYQSAVDRLTPVTSEDCAMGQSACLYMGQSYLKLDNYNAATLALDKACRMTHDAKVQEKAFYNLAVARSQGGRVPFGSSVELFEEFLKRYPTSEYVPQVADYVANGYMTDNNYSAALSALEKVECPGDAVLAIKQRVLYGLGIRELQSGNASGALTHLREAVSLARYDRSVASEATLWMGECQYELGNYDGAIKSYNSYLRGSEGTKANRALAYYDLGYARFARKQFSQAASDFSRFMADTPDKKNAHLMADAGNRLADCHYYASDFTSAAEWYGKAYGFDPSAGDYPVYQQGMMKGLQRDHKGKIEILNRMIEEFPTSALVPSALLEMGESYGETGQSGRSVETYTLLASRYPTTAQGRKARLLLGITYLHAGNTDAAVSHYKRVITDYPSSEEARVAADDLKQIYADRGELNSYVSFINGIPDAPRPEMAELAELTLQSAEKAVEEGRYDEARAHAAEVVEKYPDSSCAVDALAIKANAEMELGMSPQALESYMELERRASEASDINAARMGIMRVSRDMADNERVVDMADKLLASTSLGASGKSETAFMKAMALSDLNRGDEAAKIWKELAKNIDDLTGTKSAYYLAQYYFDNKHDKQALEQVNALIDANPPHDYWLARGFILLSDILRRKGSDFEADEYLRSLKENYPGKEADIFRMIDERLQ